MAASGGGAPQARTLPLWTSRKDFVRTGADQEYFAKQQEAKKLPVPLLQQHFDDAAAAALRSGARCRAAPLDGGVLCVSLPSCLDRREHTKRELTSWGFPAPRFVDALGPNDREALEWFNSNKVFKFPPCFRCRGPIMRCYCPNNVMLIEQVANWLSFRKAWKTIASGRHEWYLLVEDDVKFTHKAAECWNALVTRDLLDSCSGSPCIIRCGWQLGWDYMDDLPPELAEGVIRMANHCSILNRSMAEVLLAGSDLLLESTSDMFIHEQVAPRHRNFTLFPPISYDLSFALKVPSLIRPKGVEGDDPVHVAEIRKSVRVTPNNTRAWLECLTWAPRQSGCGAVPLPATVASLGTQLHRWAELEPEARGLPKLEPAVGDASFTLQLDGTYVVRDPEPPPQWVYAARRLYFGQEVLRPRGYLPVGGL